MASRKKSKRSNAIQSISVIVPDNPFAPENTQCLCAVDVTKLMEWWPGTPHSPHRDPSKVKAIQRSLDWKRVAHIAAYLLQQEIIDASEKVNTYFKEIYQPKKNDPGREWPPKINKVIGFERSEFPTFSNVLLHVNGAKINRIKGQPGAARLLFNPDDPRLNFSVIDGQHRINGAYLAICIGRQTDPTMTWEIPAEIFLDLDPPDSPPRKQAQIFIDVNFYQKRVDRSLVADLFPTARGVRESLDRKERAQDIGRKLMLETGPLVGMIQIPGIRYGVKGVIALSTLNAAVEDILEDMEAQDLTGLDTQSEFLAQCLTAWLEASGRFEASAKSGKSLNPQNVAYQGRILVSVLNLVPAMMWKLKNEAVQFVSDKALTILTDWLKEIAKKANMLDGDSFIPKDRFKERGYLGSGGTARFRDSLWAVTIGKKPLGKARPLRIAELANKNRARIGLELSTN